MLAALLTALVLAAVADVAIIAPEQAKEYVGQDVVVLGRVAQVGASKDGQTLFLNFGGQYPDHAFNAVIFHDNLQFFPEARSWEGKLITLRGQIQLYKGKGKPEIILERQEQVMIDSSTVPQGTAPAGVEGGVEGGHLGETLGGMPSGTGTGAVMDFDSPPRVKKQARPEYPQKAFMKGIEGTVLIEALVDSQGRVARARVIQSVPLLDEAALQAVYKWAFQPALKRGLPVATIIHMPVSFRIYNTKKPEQREQRPAKSPGR